MNVERLQEQLREFAEERDWPQFHTPKSLDFEPSWNPYQEETTDRTGPSVLESLTELSEFHAAKAHYETVTTEQHSEYPEHEHAPDAQLTATELGDLPHHLGLLRHQVPEHLDTEHRSARPSSRSEDRPPAPPRTSSARAGRPAPRGVGELPVGNATGPPLPV